MPHHIELDRVLIAGDPTVGQKRAIAANAAYVTIENSDIRDIKAAGQDSQAIAAWNSPGPFTIRNNYLEAAGENVMFGGADISIPGVIPSDITLENNILTKDPAWRGSSWTVKNVLELKNAQARGRSPQRPAVCLGRGAAGVRRRPHAQEFERP